MLNFAKIKEIIQSSRLALYYNVIKEIETAFDKYEGGRISINAYLETVVAIEQTFRRQRPIWLWMLDGSGVLRGLNRSEREAFLETSAALAWCRDWALRQREIEMTSCLASASESPWQDPANLEMLAA